MDNVSEVVNWEQLTDKQKQIVETYHRLHRERGFSPTDEDVADEAYDTCPNSYVHYLHAYRAPYMFETEPVEVQARLHEEPDPISDLLTNSPEVSNDVISLYHEARSRGYSVSDLAPMREVILTETSVSWEDLE